MEQGATSQKHIEQLAKREHTSVLHASNALMMSGLNDAAAKAAQLLTSQPDDGQRDTSEQIAAGFLRDCRRRGLDAAHVLKNIIRLQRAYRLQIYVYKNFGAALFFDSQGGSSHGPRPLPRHPRATPAPPPSPSLLTAHALPTCVSSGSIDFLEGSLVNANWIRVVPTSSTGRLVKMLDHYWGLQKPELVITITGGAQNFALSSALQACPHAPRTHTLPPPRTRNLTAADIASAPPRDRRPSTVAWPPRRPPPRRGS